MSPTLSALQWCLPGSCTQSSDPSLQDSLEEDEGVLASDDKVTQEERSAAMDEETEDDC